MTSNYFENAFVKLHYYKFGCGVQHMFCFHGMGMHGKQFALLEEPLGHKYTFWGFDLFFHKQTKLKDQSLKTIMAGLPKKQLVELMEDFCAHQQVNKFSIVSYSLGTCYATTIIEGMPHMVDLCILAAPAAVRPSNTVVFLSKNIIGNAVFRKLMVSKSGAMYMIRFAQSLRLLDSKNAEILFREIATPDLRLAIYANFTYLRFFRADHKLFKFSLKSHNIRPIFIFGQRDKTYPPKMAANFFKSLPNAERITLNANHDMIGQEFAQTVKTLLA